MIDLAIAFGGGLVVGWNFLKQPQWVADIIAKVVAKFTKS